MIDVLHQLRDRFAARGLPVPRDLAVALLAVERAPEPARGRLLRAAREAIPALKSLSADDAALGSAPLCPSYPLSSDQVQARLALGTPPARILRGLTPREAHAALSAGVEDPIEWILRDCPWQGARSPRVARWLVACWRDAPRRDALQRERCERGPGGVEVRGRLIDRIDEITPRDLDRGESTGVERAYHSAARRAYERWSREESTQHEPLAATPRWYRSVRCTRLLNTAAALQREGRELSHCVGGYSAAVRAGRSVIVALYVCGERSTVELDRAGRVQQHKGPSNRAPHALCQRALAVCLRRWGVSS